MNEYSNSKATWHLGRISDMREGRQTVPINIQLILSDFCNHDCHFCAYRASNGLSSADFGGLDAHGKPTHNPNRMMRKDAAMQILIDAAKLGVKSITFTGGGEPTAHPNHLLIFNEALAFGFDCSLNTNGAILKKGWQNILPQFKYIRFSIDGGTPGDYAATRNVPIGTYKTVLTNLATLCAAVEPEKCTVGTGYVVTPDNYKFLRQGVRNIKDAGARYVRIASMQSTLGQAVYGTELEKIRTYIADAMNEQTPDFQVHNLFDQSMGRVMEHSFCGFQQVVVYIGANMKVYRCCYTAYSQLGQIGDLSNISFYDWFHSVEKRIAIGTFNAKSCPTCPLADKNAAIQYMLDTPTHVNFP